MRWHRRLLLLLMTLALGAGQLLAPVQAAWVGSCCRARAEGEDGAPAAGCCCSKRNQDDDQTSQSKPSCCRKHKDNRAKSPRKACCRPSPSGKPVVQGLAGTCGCYKAAPEPFANQRPTTSPSRQVSEYVLEPVAEASTSTVHRATSGEFFADLPPPYAVWIRHCALLL